MAMRCWPSPRRWRCDVGLAPDPPNIATSQRNIAEGGGADGDWTGLGPFGQGLVHVLATGHGPAQELWATLGIIFEIRSSSRLSYRFYIHLKIRLLCGSQLLSVKFPSFAFRPAQLSANFAFLAQLSNHRFPAQLR